MVWILEIGLVVFLWFLKVSGVYPDMSWLVVLAPVWVPYAIVLMLGYFVSLLPGKSRRRARR
jgi:hypothetical protein